MLAAKIRQRQFEFWNRAQRVRDGRAWVDGFDSGANGELLLALYKLDALSLPVLRRWVFITVFTLNIVTQLVLVMGQRGMSLTFSGGFKQAKSGGADQDA